jgi:DNA-binding XRE family transcriptional regulator|tara:strand:- start:514 stop:702 length:189 start_codon:yes stop_codon:yes gene_type:complete
MQNPQLIKAYKKTIKTIESCNTEEQLKIASRMVKNFKKMYKQVGYPKVLSYSLDRVLKRKKI